MRILLVEDEVVLSDQIRKLLAAEGRIVDVVHDGQEACFRGATEPYDMIILDIGLPLRDGISILKEWRSTGVATPVLILTARDGWSDRVDGLDAGADDYLTKPFHLPELAARVRATLRRSAGRISPLFERDGVVFDTRHSRATLNGVPVTLSPNGFVETGSLGDTALTGPLVLTVTGKSGAANGIFATYSGTINVTVVPEPSTALLMGLGLGGLVLATRRARA